MRFSAATAVLVALLLILPALGTISLPAVADSFEASAMPQTPGARAILGTRGSNGPASPPVSGLSQAESSPVLYLPTISNQHRPRPPCTPDSPFAIQIAALHMVPGEAATAAEAAAANAEWLAWLDEAFPDLVRALEESGACWARVRVNWQHYERDQAWFDDRLGLVAGAGVQLIGIIDDVPDWARGEPYPGYSCTHVAEDSDPPDELVQFVTDLVNHYKEAPWNVHVWEFRNEPDGVDPIELDPIGQGCGGERADLYVDNLQRAYQAVKAADPTATVLMGGLAYDRFTEYGGPFNRYFPDDVMANGGDGYMDALNVHYFPDFYQEWERWVWQPGDSENTPATCGDVEDGLGEPYEASGTDVMAKVKHLRNRMDTCFGVQKPVWITEMGEHGDPDVPGSLEQQARYVVQGMVRGLAAGAENITWFSLIAPPYDTANQGLLYDDMSPKPAYGTYQTLTLELAGYDYSYTRDVEGAEAYAFVDTRGREKTVAWASGEPGGQVFLVFAEPGRVRIVDRQGTLRYVEDGGAGDWDEAQNGSIKLALPPVPDPDPGNPQRLTAEPIIISR